MITGTLMLNISDASVSSARDPEIYEDAEPASVRILFSQALPRGAEEIPL